MRTIIVLILLWFGAAAAAGNDYPVVVDQEQDQATFQWYFDDALSRLRQSFRMSEPGLLEAIEVGMYRDNEFVFGVFDFDLRVTFTFTSIFSQQITYASLPVFDGTYTQPFTRIDVSSAEIFRATGQTLVLDFTNPLSTPGSSETCVPSCWTIHYPSVYPDGEANLNNQGVANADFTFRTLVRPAPDMSESELTIKGCFPTIDDCTEETPFLIPSNGEFEYQYGALTVTVAPRVITLESTGGSAQAEFNGVVISGFDFPSEPDSVIGGIALFQNTFGSFSDGDIAFTGNSIAMNFGDDSNAGSARLFPDLRENAAPLADAGGPYTVIPSEGLTLDASGSSDSDDAIVAYQWDLDNDGTYETESLTSTLFLEPASIAGLMDLTLGSSNTINLRVLDASGVEGLASSTVLNNSVVASDCFDGIADSCSLQVGTGLEWLDMSYSVGLSYLDALGQTGMGGSLAGFRFASQAETERLLADAGIPIIPGNNPANRAPISGLIDLTGANVVAGSFRATGGSTADPGGIPDSRTYIEIAHDAAAFGSVINNASQPDANSDAARAHWLVKLPPDADGDGVPDASDNCITLANTDQRDSNGDGFGNVCDPDLNDDGVVNVIDLGILRTVFFQPDVDADFNGDGVVNVIDLGVMRTFFFQPPGPSALQ